MYSSQTVYDRINKVIRDRKKSMEGLNEECNFSKNTVSQSANSHDGMKARRLYAIAEYLDCSLDYLFGRTENPTAHKCTASAVALGDISNNSGVIGGIANSAPVTINNGSAQLSDNAAAMLEIFDTLDTVSQAELLVHANKLKNDNIRIVK